MSDNFKIYKRIHEEEVQSCLIMRRFIRSEGNLEIKADRYKYYTDSAKRSLDILRSLKALNLI